MWQMLQKPSTCFLAECCASHIWYWCSQPCRLICVMSNSNFEVRGDEFLATVKSWNKMKNNVYWWGNRGTCDLNLLLIPKFIEWMGSSLYWGQRIEYQEIKVWLDVRFHSIATREIAPGISLSKIWWMFQGGLNAPVHCNPVCVRPQVLFSKVCLCRHWCD